MVSHINSACLKTISRLHFMQMCTHLSIHAACYITSPVMDTASIAGTLRRQKERESSPQKELQYTRAPIYDDLDF